MFLGRNRYTEYSAGRATQVAVQFAGRLGASNMAVAAAGLVLDGSVPAEPEQKQVFGEGRAGTTGSAGIGSDMARGPDSGAGAEGCC